MPLNATSISILEFDAGGVAESVRVVQFAPSTDIPPSLFRFVLQSGIPVLLPPSPLSCEEGESSPPLPPSCTAGGCARELMYVFKQL